MSDQGDILKEKGTAWKKRRGFLPIETNFIDRIFIAAIIWVLFNLLWMRFVESYVPLWVSTIISIIYSVIIIIKG